MVVAVINNCAYTPALPTLATYFHHSIQRTQSLVVIGLLGQCILPIYFAVVASKKSRHQAIQRGLWLCLIGDALCLTAAFLHDYSFFSLGILTLSFGGSMGMSMALTLLRDQNNNQLTKSISLSMLSFAILPGIAIATAGALLDFLGWISIFWALGCYHLLLIYLLRFIAQPSSAALTALPSFSYKTFANFRLVQFAFLAGLLSGIMYIFTATSPHIAMDLLGVTPIAFGLWSNLASVGMLVGGILAYCLSEKSFRFILFFASALIFVGIVLIILSLYDHFFNAAWFFIAASIIHAGIQLGFPLLASSAVRLGGNHAMHAGFFSVMHFMVASIIVRFANCLPYAAVSNLLVAYVLCWLVFTACGMRIKAT